MCTNLESIILREALQYVDVDGCLYLCVTRQKQYKTKNKEEWHERKVISAESGPIDVL